MINLNTTDLNELVLKLSNGLGEEVYSFEP